MDDIDQNQKLFINYYKNLHEKIIITPEWVNENHAKIAQILAFLDKKPHHLPIKEQRSVKAFEENRLKVDINTDFLVKLQNIIEDDGTKIKEQLVLASLFIMVFEQFKGYVDRLCRDFFAYGDDYKEIVKKYGKGLEGQHTSKSFRAAVYWLSECEAISQSELDNIEDYALLRNDIGHELFSVLVSDFKPLIKLEDIKFILTIYQKVVRWWFREVEIIIDFEKVESVESILLKAIIEKAVAKML